MTILALILAAVVVPVGLIVPYANYLRRWAIRKVAEKDASNLRQCAFLRDEREEARKAASERLDKVLAIEATHADEVRRFTAQIAEMENNRDVWKALAEEITQAECVAASRDLEELRELHLENERLKTALIKAGVKPVEQQEAEHDFRGAVKSLEQEWSKQMQPITITSKQAETLEKLLRTEKSRITISMGDCVDRSMTRPRVRDDEAND